MSKFLNKPIPLSVDFSGITATGIGRLEGLIGDYLFDSSGKIAPEFSRPVVVSEIYLVADEQERNNLNPVKGDFCKYTQGNGEMFIYDVDEMNVGSWVNITYPNLLSANNDVIITNPQESNILCFTNGKWRNISDVNATKLKNTGITLTSPQNGQFLTYNGTEWVNTSFLYNLSGCQDTLISSPQENQLLIYKSGKWTNSTLIVSTSPTLNQTLTYDGTKYVNSKLALSALSGTGASSKYVIKWGGVSWIASQLFFTDISSISLNSIQNKQALIYNGTNWTNTTITLSSLNDVVNTNPDDGYILVYNGALAKYESKYPPFPSTSSFDSHISNENIHRNIPNPAGNNNKVLGVSGDIFSFVDNFTPDVSDLVTGDLLTWNGSVWSNAQPTQKPIAEITSSRELNDYGKVLYNYGNYIVSLSASAPFGSEIEIYNYGTLNLWSFFENCSAELGRYTKLKYFTSWIRITDEPIIIPDRLIVTTTQLAPSTIGIDSCAYVTLDNSTLIFNYPTSGTRVYKLWNLNDNSLIGQISGTMAYSSNIISNADLAFMTAESNNSGNLVINRTDDLYISRTFTTITATDCSFASKNIVYNSVTQCLNVPYMSITGVIRIGTYQLSNDAVSLISTGIELSATDIVAGWSQGYGVLMIKTATSLNVVVSDVNTGDYSHGINSSSIYNASISCTDTSMTYVATQGSDLFNCITYTSTQMTIWELAKNHRGIFKLFTINTNVVTNGVRIGFNIYVTSIKSNIVNLHKFKTTKKKLKNKINTYNQAPTSNKKSIITGSPLVSIDWVQNAVGGFWIDKSCNNF